MKVFLFYVIHIFIRIHLSNLYCDDTKIGNLVSVIDNPYKNRIDIHASGFILEYYYII